MAATPCELSRARRLPRLSAKSSAPAAPAALLALAALLAPASLPRARAYEMSFDQTALAPHVGVMTAVLQCPSTAGLKPGASTPWQVWCEQNFQDCVGSPAVQAGGAAQLTAVQAVQLVCTHCWAALFACYADCPKPGAPVTFSTQCNDACKPRYMWVCSGAADPAA